MSAELIRYSIREWPRSERPRERMQDLGPAALSTAELLAVLVSSGAPGRSALEVARELLGPSGSLRDLAERSPVQLTGIRGVGEAKALRVVAALELGRRVAREPARRRPRIGGPGDVVALMGPVMEPLRQEVFSVLLLNSQNEVLKELALFRGSLTASLVHPREVFRPAVIEAAGAVLFIHNHPSGTPQPSGEDRRLTRQLVEAGLLLGIPVLDHVILGEAGRYFSFAEAGLIKAG